MIEALDLSFSRGRLPEIDREMIRDIVTRFVANGHDGPWTEEQIDAVVEMQIAKIKSDVIWLSSTHQINIDATTATSHYSIKRRDKESIMSRDNLLSIAQRFNSSRSHVCVELYPGADRVVDTANQYHLWRVPRRGLAAPEEIKTSLEKPFEACPTGLGGSLLYLPLGSDRDWRRVQSSKCEIFGADVEAVDLMVPETRGLGPVLHAAPKGARIPVGWSQSLEDYGGGGSWRQRPLQ